MSPQMHFAQPRRVRATLLAAIALLPFAANAQMFTQVRQRPPTSEAVVDLPLQRAHRNLVAGLRRCAPYAPLVSGMIYPDEGYGEIEVTQAHGSVVALAFIALHATDGARTRVVAWHNKPTFGEGLTQYAKPAPVLAVEGAEAKCAELGF